MERSWMIVRTGEIRTFETKLAEVCPVLKGLARVLKASNRAEYMRKWHAIHDYDWEVRDGEESLQTEEERS